MQLQYVHLQGAMFLKETSTQKAIAPQFSAYILLGLNQNCLQQI